jgi:hypothetical protein
MTQEGAWCLTGKVPLIFRGPFRPRITWDSADSNIMDRRTGAGAGGDIAAGHQLITQQQSS